MEPRERSQVTYQHGLSLAQCNDAAWLYELAFGEKFSGAISNRADRVSLIESGLKPEYAFTAIASDQLVGLAGYHTPTGSLTGGITGHKILKQLGLVKGTKACIILSLYQRTASHSELLMDGIVVHPDYRSRGIGTELLKRIVAYAENCDYRSVRLDVIDTNPSARKLYGQFGFIVTREERYPYLARILGFGGSATMEYKIASAA